MKIKFFTMKNCKMLVREIIEILKETQYGISINDFVNQQKNYEQGHFFERLFDLMQRGGFIHELKNFEAKYGGFGNKKCSINNIETKNFLEKKVHNGKGNGSIDLAFFHDDTKRIICLTLKFFEKLEPKYIEEYDLSQLKTASYGLKSYMNGIYKDFTFEYGIVTNCSFELMKKKLKNCTKEIANEIKYIFTTDVFDVSFKNFHKKILECSSIEEVFKIKKEKLELRFYQEYIVKKIFKIFEKSNSVLLGALPRIGKTYIVAHIIESLKYKNVLFSSDVVTNLKEGVCEDFNKLSDSQFNKNFYKEIKDISFDVNKCNLIVMSNQYLKNNENYKKIKHKFDLIICDEAHIGGTSEPYQDVCKFLSNKNTKIIYSTATFKKPKDIYNLSDEQIITFGINEVCGIMNQERWIVEEVEITLCRKIQQAEFKELMYPKINLCSLGLDKIFTENVNELLSENIHSSYEDKVTFFSNSFTVIENGSNKSFTNQGERQIKIVLDYVFKRRDEIKHGRDMLTKISNQFLGNKSPRMIICYVPAGMYDKKSEDVLPLIHKLFKETYDNELYIPMFFHSANSKNMKSDILEMIKYRNDKTVVVFVHKLLQTAITIKECDGVILLDDTHSEDQIFQRIFRPATYIPGKDNVFVLDINPARSIDIVLNHGYMSGRIKNENDGVGYLRSIETLLCFRRDNINEIYNDDFYANIIRDYFKRKTVKDQLTILTEQIVFDDEKIKMLLGLNVSKSSNNIQTISKLDINNKKYVIEKEKDTFKEKQENIEEKLKNLKKIYKEVIKRLLYMVIITNYDKENMEEMLEEMSFDLLSRMSKQCGINLTKEEFIKEIKSFSQELICITINNIKSKMSTESIKERHQVITDFLKPTEYQKKNNGEVFTPLETVNEMLDTLPKSVWEDPNLKWLDPAVGIGNFPIVIYERLMNGLINKIPDENVRKTHILEKMIFAVDICEVNISIYKLVMGYHKNYNGNNIITGSTLEEETLKDIHFDVIVGNPPYNETFVNTSAKPLYNKFIDKLIDKCDMMLFIIPSRWFAGGKGLDDFRERMLKRTDIKMIKHVDDAKSIFGNFVDIKGGINYFLIDKKYNGKCDFNGVLIDINRYDILVNNKYDELIEFVKSYTKLESLYQSASYYKIKTNDNRLLKTNDENTLKCYVSKQKGFINYIGNEFVKNDENLTKWKVLTARAAHVGNSGFGNIFIAGPNEVYSQSYIAFVVSDKEEAESLLSYIKCKLPNVLLSLRKISQDIHSTTCSWIPLVPLDRIWNDSDVYAYFNMSKELIQLVEDAKIKGYKK